VLRASSVLGAEIATLLDPETPVRGVTVGTVRPELRVIGPLATTAGGAPAVDTDALLSVTARWGYVGSGGVTMPAQGKVAERAYTRDELAAIEEGTRALGMTLEQALKCLGDRTYDIYLNGEAYWRNVPSGVWSYTASGYQVIKKWLSYRERAVMGRPLTKEEARTITGMARRIAALLLLGPALDANYESATHVNPVPIELLSRD